MRTARLYAALLAIAAAFAALFAVLAPAAGAATVQPAAGRYTSTCADAPGAQTPDRAWVAHVVGCATEVDDATATHLVVLRDATCDGLTAQVPAARIVAVLAAELGGDRTEAVTVFTDAAVWCATR